MKSVVVCFACVISLFVCTVAVAQLSPEEAMARLKARQQKAAATTQASTQPASSLSPTTRPASLKEAHRIVFLVDARIIFEKLSALKEELRLAVDHLRDDQMFTIIVARSPSQIPSEFRSTPVRATKAVKEDAADFIRGIQADRGTAIVPAVRRAVALNPDFMYFIAEDETPRTEQVRQAFTPFHGRLNVLYFRLFDLHPSDFLRDLALEHGGVGIDQYGKELPAVQVAKPAGTPPASRPSVLER